MKWVFVACALLVCPVVASAQGPAPPVRTDPMPWVVLDLRGAWPALGEDELAAGSLERPPSDLPTRAYTGIAGLHAYPIRFRTVKIGVGGEVLMGRGRFQRKNADGEAELDPVNRWLESTTWQVSLNFGRGQGWSYLTAGSGLFFRDIFEGDGEGDAPGRNTINVGGGARWFKWRHVGFTADLRFYLTRASDGGERSTPTSTGRIIVLSAGITIK